MVVPDTEEKIDFIVKAETSAETNETAQAPAESQAVPSSDVAVEEFDLSDVSVSRKSREEIIAEAEAAAFAQG